VVRRYNNKEKLNSRRPTKYRNKHHEQEDVRADLFHCELGRETRYTSGMGRVPRCTSKGAAARSRTSSLDTPPRYRPATVQEPSHGIGRRDPVPTSQLIARWQGHLNLNMPTQEAQLRTQRM
jgi:hypothetical protein